MEKHLRRYDYKQMIRNAYEIDTGIGDDIRIFNDYSLDPVVNYDFESHSNSAILIKKGHGTLSIDERSFRINAPCLVIYFTEQKIRTNIQSDDNLQWCMELSDKFLEDINMSALKFNDIRSSILQNPVTYIDDQLIPILDIYANALNEFAFKPEIINKLICVKHLTLALFYGPLYEFFKKKTESVTFRAPKISSDFFNLLEKSYMSEHKLSFYAGKLSISEKYLYVTVISATGKSPRYWIEYNLFIEAKRLLSNRELSVQQIADQLHFSSLSSFGKFFTRLSGTSPSKYREEITRI